MNINNQNEIKEREYSTREKEVRDNFIEEYFIDFDVVKAARRLGYEGQFAVKFGYQFIDESYVARTIAKKEKEQSLIPEDEEKETIRKIRSSLLKEAQFNGEGASHAARISALSKLATIYGMDAPQKIENIHKGGVMVIPRITNDSEWEHEAIKIQKELQQNNI